MRSVLYLSFRIYRMQLNSKLLVCLPAFLKHCIAALICTRL